MPRLHPTAHAVARRHTDAPPASPYYSASRHISELRRRFGDRCWVDARGDVLEIDFLLPRAVRLGQGRAGETPAFYIYPAPLLHSPAGPLVSFSPSRTAGGALSLSGCRLFCSAPSDTFCCGLLCSAPLRRCACCVHADNACRRPRRARRRRPTATRSRCARFGLPARLSAPPAHLAAPFPTPLSAAACRC